MNFSQDESDQVRSLKRQREHDKIQISQLEQASVKAKEEVQELKSKVNDLQLAVDEGLARLDETEREKDALRQEMIQTKVTMANAQQALHQAKGQVQQGEKNRRMDDVTRDDAAGRRERDLIRERDELEKRYAKLEVQLRDVQNTSKQGSVASHHSALEKENVALKAEIGALKAQHQSDLAHSPGGRSVSSRRSRRSSGINVAGTEEQQLREINSELSTQIEQVEAKAAKAEQEAMKASNERLASERKSQGQIEHLKAERDELKDEVKLREDHVNELERQLSSIDALLSIEGGSADSATWDSAELKAQQLVARVSDAKLARRTLEAFASSTGNVTTKPKLSDLATAAAKLYSKAEANAKAAERAVIDANGDIQTLRRELEVHTQKGKTLQRREKELAIGKRKLKKLSSALHKALPTAAGLDNLSTHDASISIHAPDETTNGDMTLSVRGFETDLIDELDQLMSYVEELDDRLEFQKVETELREETLMRERNDVRDELKTVKQQFTIDLETANQELSSLRAQLTILDETSLALQTREQELSMAKKRLRKLSSALRKALPTSSEEAAKEMTGSDDVSVFASVDETTVGEVTLGDRVFDSEMVDELERVLLYVEVRSESQRVEKEVRAQEARAEGDALRRTIQGLREEKRETEQAHGMNLLAVKRELERAQNQLDEQVALHEAETQKNAEATEALFEAKEQLTTLHEEMSDAKSILEEKEAELCQVTGKMRNLSKRLCDALPAPLTGEIDLSVDAFDALTEALLKVVHELDRLLDVQQLERKLSDDAVKVERAGLEERIQSLGEQLAEASSAHAVILKTKEDALQETEQEIARGTESIAKLHKEMAEMQQAHAAASHALREDEDRIRAEYKEIELRNHELEQKHQDSERANVEAQQELQDELASAGKRLDELRSKFEEMTMNPTKESEITDLQRKVSELEAARETTREEYERQLNDAREELRLAKESAPQDEKAVQSSIDVEKTEELEAKIVALEKQLAGMAEQHSVSVGKLTEELDHARAIEERKMNEESTQQAKEHQERVSELYEQLALAQQQLRDTEDAQREDVVTLEHELSEQKEIVVRLHEQIVQLEHKGGDTQQAGREEVDALKKQLDDLQEQMSTLSAEGTAATLAHESALRELESALTLARADNEHQKATLDLMTEQIDNSAKSHAAAVQAYERDLDEAKSILEQEIASHKAELKEKLASAMMTVEQLEQELALKAQECEDADDKELALRKDNKRLAARLAQLQARLEKMSLQQQQQQKPIVSSASTVKSVAPVAARHPGPSTLARSSSDLLQDKQQQQPQLTRKRRSREDEDDVSEEQNNGGPSSSTLDKGLERACVYAPGPASLSTVTPRTSNSSHAQPVVRERSTVVVRRSTSAPKEAGSRSTPAKGDQDGNSVRAQAMIEAKTEDDTGAPSLNNSLSKSNGAKPSDLVAMRMKQNLLAAQQQSQQGSAIHHSANKTPSAAEKASSNRLADRTNRPRDAKPVVASKHQPGKLVHGATPTTNGGDSNFMAKLNRFRAPPAPTPANPIGLGTGQQQTSQTGAEQRFVRN